MDDFAGTNGDFAGTNGDFAGTKDMVDEMLEMIFDVLEDNEVSMTVTLPKGSLDPELQMYPEGIAGDVPRALIAITATEKAVAQLMQAHNASEEDTIDIVEGIAETIAENILRILGLREEDEDEYE